MSIVTLAILAVSFGLLGAMVAWFAYKTVRRAELGPADSIVADPYNAALPAVAAANWKG